MTTVMGSSFNDEDDYGYLKAILEYSHHDISGDDDTGADYPAIALVRDVMLYAFIVVGLMLALSWGQKDEDQGYEDQGYEEAAAQEVVEANHEDDVFRALGDEEEGFTRTEKVLG
jgi:hypothetical protein